MAEALLGKGSPEALEVTEAARETEWHHPSFIAELFMGRFRTDLIFPYPDQPAEDRKIGDEFLARLHTFLREHLDPDEIDRTGDMPRPVLDGLAALGCFGMKIPKQYGGLGLSQTNYNRAIALLGSHCGSTAVWLSAHQSIGLPQPLMLFGTEQQKQQYLPRMAKGMVSAFALTEPGVGSDPANMLTTATLTEDGEAYILNGEKLWCTNGPVAEVLVVMARTPSIMKHGRERKQITAFIVEKTMPGFEVAHRCDFMGLKGIQNGVVRLTNVRVPKANIIWGLGQGLKLALITLNAGRIAIPAGSVGTAKRCLQICREWGNERVQWGQAIGKHEAVAAKIGAMAAMTFAMDAMVWLSSALVDKHTFDIRLEAATAKLFCSEAAWRIVDDTVQVRGGRGYETARSLRARGEQGIPVERIMRDMRINRIIEGTSEVMRLFIAREALDAHMRLVSKMLDPRSPIGVKLGTFLKATTYYVFWYPSLWLSWGWWPRHAGAPPKLGTHLRYIHRASRRLARILFHSAMRYQTGLAHKQQLLGRLVDAGADLFAMAAACAKAQSLHNANPSDTTPIELADLFCRDARDRVNLALWRTSENHDRPTYDAAQGVLGGRFAWLEDGLV